jgi:hypothetical protein
VIAEFFAHAFTLPTTVWSVLLILTVLYWASSLLGIFNLEILEGLLEISEASEGLGGAEAGPGFFEKTGFADIPRPFNWSLITFFGWTFSLLLSFYVPGYQALVARGLAYAVGLGFAALALAIVATAIAIQPLRRFMVTGLGPERADLVGRLCTVRTQRIDEKFGQAEVDDGAMLIQVRAPVPNDFHRGTRGLIFEYREDLEVFSITPYDEKP